MRRSRSVARVVAVGVGLCCLGLAAGCSSTSASAFRSDVTPRLDSLGQSDQELLNQYALIKDDNLRMLRDDWDRFWLLDKQSTLTPWGQTVVSY